jgi:TRAP transporter TAXI family solute receptor
MKHDTLKNKAAAICITLAASGLSTGAADAQTIGIATMQPGTVSHTTAAALAKAVKDKAGINALVQPTAGETVAIAIVGKGEVELGLANAPEFASAVAGPAGSQLRLIGAVHPLRVAFFVRKDSPIKSIADLKGRRVTMGYSAMRVIDGVTRAILATSGITEKDVQPILVPNVIRSADDFAGGASDMFYFAFGAPKVREVDAGVGGIRALEIPESPGIAAAAKISPHGYLTTVQPGPAFVGVAKPTRTYTFDNLLFTHAGVPDATVYKILEAFDGGKADMVQIQPVLGGFSVAGMHKKYDMAYHPGALKYFQDKKIEAKALD